MSDVERSLALTTSSGLPFKAHDELEAADVIERGNLYRAVAKPAWSPVAPHAVAHGEA